MEKGINTGLHYPVPLHMLDAYTKTKHFSGNYPVTEKVAREIISLPMFPELTVDQQEHIAYEINRFFHYVLPFTFPIQP
jgi:dTDP-4-amino-4,6-dideoxygalactose transaminase